MDQIFDSANVVVTTMQVAGRAEAPVQERMAARASALFIDEAHHIGAPTWARFRGSSSIATAATHRSVHRHTLSRRRPRVDGEFIYTYPLKKAQAEGYFKPIRFEAVFGLDQADADQAIAEKLGEVCRPISTPALTISPWRAAPRSTAQRSFTNSTSALFPEFRPVIVHSQQPTANDARTWPRFAASRAGSSSASTCWAKASTCPSSRSPALHDPHKSIAVTIQFVGRFTRQDPTLGDATVIANTGVDDIDRSLAKLYAEDADWNALVEALSTAQIGRQVRRAEMFKGFVGDLSDIPLQTLEPKMNAVVYRTSCDTWEPLRAEDLYNPGVYLGMKINPHQRVAIFVTRSEEQARWTTAQHATNVIWDSI